MANKRTRDRQLAKLAVRRQAERRARQRKRNAALVGGVIGLVAVIIAVYLFATGDEPAKRAAPNPPKLEPVAPERAPKQVWCGAKAPKNGEDPRPQFAEQPAMAIDPGATYIVTMETSCGTIELELFAGKAPTTVNSFVFLAREAFYDGLRFHRVVPGFVIQGGDPLGSGSGGPGYQFPNELAKGEEFDRGGVLAMANSGPDTNGSQFFITLDETPQLTPDRYTIFGEVTEGLDVAERIADVPATEEIADESVYIDRVTIREK